MLNKFFPMVVFGTFFLLILGAFLFFSPSWGLMDDFQMLERVKYVWSGGNILSNLTQIIIDDFGWGMFRPVFWIWSMLIYHVLGKMPLLIYLSISVFNFSYILLWGLILHKTWATDEKNVYYNIFVFPLSFFIFTPFWNNFMYISPQTKFILFFSALATYFFYLGYTKNSKKYIILSVSAIILGVLSHPEGIFLSLVMLFSPLSIYLIKKKRILVFSFLLNLLFFIVYLFFTITVQLKGSYTSRYGDGLNLSKFILNFLGAPVLIKLLFFIALFYICFLFIIIRKNKNKFSPVFLILPLSFICFIIILNPWGYPSYHLSVLTPFIMAMYFPVYNSLNAKYLVLKILNNTSLILLILLVLAFICFPRISKMSDIPKTKHFLINIEKEQSGNVYFMPSPCEEASVALGYFTKTKINYLSDNLLSGNKLSVPGDNFLIFRDECPSACLEGVRAVKEVYSNNTWKVFLIKKDPGFNEELNLLFHENIVERIKSYLKR